MRHRFSRDVIGALAVAAVALVYLQQALRLPLGSARMPGTGFVPLLFGFALLGLCVLLVGYGMLVPGASADRKGAPAVEEDLAESTGWQKPLTLVVVLLVYPLAMEKLGFVVSTAGVLYAALRVMNYHNWTTSLLLAVAATLVAYLLFGIWLGVCFPHGILW